MDIFALGLVTDLMHYPDRDDAQGTPAESAVGSNRARLYTDDRGLFELACYAFFRLDSYLFVKHAAYRDQIADSVLETLLALFGEALGKRQARRIFKNRVQGYGLIFRTGDEEQRGAEDHLAALMCIAKRGNVIVDYDFNESPMKNMGYGFEYGYGFIAVSAWLAGFTPLFIKNVDGFVRWIENDSAARTAATLVREMSAKIEAAYSAFFVSCSDIDHLPIADRELANRARTFEATQISAMYGIETILATAGKELDAAQLQRFGGALLPHVAADMSSRAQQVVCNSGYDYDASNFKERYDTFVRSAPNGIPTLAYTRDFILERTMTAPTGELRQITESFLQLWHGPSLLQGLNEQLATVTRSHNP
jgi:hypothetical protein